MQRFFSTAINCYVRNIKKTCNFYEIFLKVLCNKCILGTEFLFLFFGL